MERVRQEHHGLPRHVDTPATDQIEHRLFGITRRHDGDVRPGGVHPFAHGDHLAAEGAELPTQRFGDSVDRCPIVERRCNDAVPEAVHALTLRRGLSDRQSRKSVEDRERVTS